MVRSRRPIAFLALAILTTLAACGGSDSPSDPNPNPGGGDTIRGNERLGWSQLAADAASLASFRYVVYVDSNRNEMTDVSCAAWSGGAPVSCSGRPPQLTPGTHTLELAAFVIENGEVLESPRSAPLTVTVRAQTAAGQSEMRMRTQGAGGSAAETAAAIAEDGVSWSVDAYLDGLENPSDLAFAPDGRLFIAERAGRIRIASGGELDARPAAALDDVHLVGSHGGLLAIALDPEFARTRFVYALYTSLGSDGEVAFRLARLREAGGTFGERAILFDRVPAAAERPAGTVRVGPDARLYVALDDGGSPEQARRLSSPNGKILRLNLDGTTPADQPAGNPVHTPGIHSPRGIDWHPSAGRAMWAIEGSSARAGHAAHPFPREMSAASGAFYRSGLVPELTGDLLVANERGGLLRLRFERRAAAKPTSSELLLDGAIAGARALAEGPDGAIYVATDSTVVRVRPASASAR